MKLLQYYKTKLKRLKHMKFNSHSNWKMLERQKRQIQSISYFKMKENKAHMKVMIARTITIALTMSSASCLNTLVIPTLPRNSAYKCAVSTLTASQITALKARLV